MKPAILVRCLTVGELTLLLCGAALGEGRPRNPVSVTYRVNCRDSNSGADRAYSTVTVTKWSHEAAVAEISHMIRTRDLCQSNGDQTRVTVPGSGRLLN